MRQWNDEILRISSILMDFFYRRFRGSTYFCTPHATKSDAFSSNLTIPLSNFWGWVKLNFLPFHLYKNNKNQGQITSDDLGFYYIRTRCALQRYVFPLIMRLKPFYFLFIFIIDVIVSMPTGQTVWQESAFEQPAPKCVLYSFTAFVGASADWVATR